MSNPFSQNPQQVIMDGRPQLPLFLAPKARGLKIVLISELMLTLWLLFLGVGLLPVLVIVPTNIIGFYGLHYLRRNLLTIFVFCKTVIVCLVVIIFIDFASVWIQCDGCGSQGGQIPIITMILLVIMCFQVVCVITANKIRHGILDPLPVLRDNVELGQVDVEPGSGSPQAQHQQPQQPAVPFAYPQFTAYAMPPYMQQGAQGYPVYPQFGGYPPNAAAGQNQPTMPAVYPTFAYPDADGQTPYPTYAMQQEAALPTEKDSDTLLQK